jgi:hypothetical protein
VNNLVVKRIISLTAYFLLVSLFLGYTFVFCCSAQEPSPSNAPPAKSNIQYSFWYPNGSIMPNPQINLPLIVAEAPASGSYTFNVCIKNDGNVPINVGYVGFQNIQVPTGVSVRAGSAQYFGMGSPVESGQNYTGSFSILFSAAKTTYTYGSSFNYSFDLVFRADNANDKTGTVFFMQALHVTGSATYPIEQATPTPAAATPSPAASSTSQQNAATQSSSSAASQSASNNQSQDSLAADPSQTTAHVSTAPEEAIPELSSVGLIVAFMALISAGALAYTLNRHRSRQR